jgi:hypothetical protein
MENQFKYFIIIGLSFMLFSCEANKEDIPVGVISKDKMIEVMTEIELTQALIKLKNSTQDTINEQQLYNEVYDEFDISEGEFNTSIDYYCKEPRPFMLMYGKVIENLTKKQSEHQRK